ncbi:hypothetical protein D9M71_588420 [compost metagenome]
MASSRIIGMGTSTRVAKPTKAVISARLPGISKPMKLRRAAVTASAPAQTSLEMKLTCCTPWETPMANTRNGTRIASGSRPKPSKVMVPNCHTTDTSEQINGRKVSTQERVYQNTASSVSTNARAKKPTTLFAPAPMSPICLAKPMICTSKSASL